MNRDEMLRHINACGVTYPHGDRGRGYDIQQHPEELAEFVLAMEALGVRTVLELGTGVNGGLARFMAHELGWKVVSVDLQRPTFVSPLATFVQSDTMTALAKLPAAQYDLVIIDADHSYDAVERDRAMYAPLATKAVMFHDIEGLRGADGSRAHWREHAYENGALRPGWHEIITTGEWRIGIGWYEVQPAASSAPVPAPAPEKNDYTPEPLLLSIVSGTYNRRAMLQRMIESARARIPDGIPYEFVILDGGSTDGTLEYLRQQPDVRLVEEGELRGAIKPFTDGGYMARGRYVIMANDDIAFLDDTIMASIAYLEANPQCGAVAYKDNRPMVGYPQGEYKVLHMAGRKNGQKVAVIYAQTGLFRKFLGDAVGWWGGNDPIMGSDKTTYGADNFLSAGIWELGYTVDALASCRIEDYMPDDELRKINMQVEKEKPQKYFQRYPHGPEIAPYPKIANPHRERLRVLLVHAFEPEYRARWVHKRGLREALSKHGLVYEVKIGDKPFDLTQIVRDWQPHLVLTQIMGGDVISESTIEQARQAKPDAVWLNWNGDVWREKLTSESVLRVLRHYDAQLVVNASVISDYYALGIPAFYWQIGVEPVDTLPDAETYDVLFMGNCYSPARADLGRMLRSLQGVKVGIFGQGWQRHGIQADGECNYDYPRMAALNRNAKIVIGDNQFPNERAFASNRLFNALGQGAFVLHQRVAELFEHTGIREDVHFVVWTDLDDLHVKIDEWLQPDVAKKRVKIAKSAKKHVSEFFNFDALVHRLFSDILPLIEDANRAKSA